MHLRISLLRNSLVEDHRGSLNAGEDEWLRAPVFRAQGHHLLNIIIILFT